MKIEVNIKKKYAFTIISILVLMSIGVLVYASTYQQPIPNPGHGGDTVWINVSGTEMTLQDAINLRKLGNSAGSASGNIITGTVNWSFCSGCTAAWCTSTTGTGKCIDSITAGSPMGTQVNPGCASGSVLTNLRLTGIIPDLGANGNSIRLSADCVSNGGGSSQSSLSSIISSATGQVDWYDLKTSDARIISVCGPAVSTGTGTCSDAGFGNQQAIIGCTDGSTLFDTILSSSKNAYGVSTNHRSYCIKIIST